MGKHDASKGERSAATDENAQRPGPDVMIPTDLDVLGEPLKAAYERPLHIPSLSDKPIDVKALPDPFADRPHRDQREGKSGGDPSSA